MNNLLVNKRIDYIDTARGMSLLAVIMGHIIFKQAQTFQFVDAFLYAFHLPLFFIISGYLFKPDHSPKEFIIKKVKGYVIPYIFCAVVISVYFILFRIIDNGAEGLWRYIIFNVVRTFTLQMRFTTLWFLTALFCAEVFLYFLFLICDKRDVLVWLIAVILGFFFVIYNMNEMHPLPWNADVSFVVVPLLLFGYTLKQYDFFNRQEVRGLFVPLLLMFLGAICAVCNFIVTGGKCLDMFAGQYHCLPLVLISAISLSVSIILLSAKIKIRVLRWLGANTMVFFAFHQSIAMDLSRRILSPFWNIDASASSLIMQILVVIVMLSMVLAICYVIHRAILKSGLGFLIGKKNRQTT